MTPQITVCLLGSYTVSSQKEPLQFRTDKVKALFAYLLLHAAMPVRRETLATLLWPESPDATARKNLRDALFHLRKTLDQGNPMLSQQCLDANRKTATLHVADCFVVDTAVLSTPNPTSDLASLVGGELLAGFHLDDAEPFMEWLLMERSRWHDLSLKLLAQWTEQHLAQKETELAQALAQKQLVLEPWHEAAHRQAMLAYGQAQDWAGVAQQYQLCSHILAEELGIEPSAKTQALYQELCQKQQALLTPQHNLPPNLSPFVGRQQELTRINTAVAQRDYRLFTLTGMGGSGKTRLALAVGQQQLSHFPDGVWFVPLASADDVADVLPAIANAMNLQLASDIPLAQQLYAELAEKSLLLILDNLEQLPEAIADVVLALLERTQKLVILTTSRARLNLRVEQLFPIEGLAFPAIQTTENLEAFEAVKLFVGQVARVRFEEPSRETYGVIGEICRLLVGSPLAIELAAAQTQQFSVAAIAETLRTSLDGLATTMRDVPPRQRSMRAVFDYSWQLLSPAQRQGLARLALFRQPFLIEAAQAVAHISRRDLAALVKSSWLKVGENGRYFFHELLREFGLDHLQQHTSWQAATQQTYVAYHLRWVRQQATQFGHDLSGKALTILRQSRADLAYAWQMGIEAGDYAAVEASAQPYCQFYEHTGLFVEGVGLFDATIAKVEQVVEAGTAVGSLLARIIFARVQLLKETRVDDSLLHQLEQAITLAQQAQNTDLVAEAAYRRVALLLRLRRFDEAYEKAIQLEKQLEETGDVVQQAETLNAIACIVISKSPILAESYWLKAANLLDPQHHPLLVASLNHNLALCWEDMGQFDAARRLHETNIDIWEQSGRQHQLAVTREGLGSTLSRQGHFEAARSHLEASLEHYERVRDYDGIANANGILGNVALALAELDSAQQYFEQVLATREQIAAGEHMHTGWRGLAEVAWRSGDLPQALHYVDLILPDLLGDYTTLETEGDYRIYWACYRILKEAGRDEAQAVLREAVEKLQESANQLDDPLKRNLFLNQIEMRRELLAAAEAHLPELVVN